VKNRYHVVIIGAGVGGLAVAEGLRDLGLDILVVDENARPGGQLLRGQQKKKKSLLQLEPDLWKKTGAALLSSFQNSGAQPDTFVHAQVIGIHDGHKLVIEYSPEASKPWQKELVELEAEIVVLATGARERYVPFPGWTMPGIMSLGAGQILLKESQILPGRSIVLGGSSPLMMALATQILCNGGRIRAMLDTNSLADQLRFLPLLFSHFPKFYEGAVHTANLLTHGASLHRSTHIIEARGKQMLDQVVTGKFDHHGALIPGSEKRIAADALCIGYGFVPNIELAVQAGCMLHYDVNEGGWLVEVDEKQRTSITNLYAVGELTGIAGGKKSYLEGQRTALSLLAHFFPYKIQRAGNEHQETLHRLGAAIGKQHEYARFFGSLCTVPSFVYNNLSDDTIICRCEDITMGEIRKRIAQGFDSLAAIKKSTRCTMGRCQGRICGAILYDIITALTDQQQETIGTPHARWPVKAVNISSFLKS